MTAKKTFKIILWAILIALLATVLFFTVAFFGNPVSQLLAKMGARNYLEEAYSGTDYALDLVGYNFKDGNYYAHVKSPTSIDGDFTIHLDWFGRVTNDDYDYRVTGGSNTERRVSMEYRALVDTLFDDPDFPYYPLHIGYGDLMIDYDEENGYIRTIGGQPVVVDGDYDIYAMGKTHGALVIYIDDDTVTPERMAEILWDLKGLLDEADIPYYKIETLSLWHPKDPETSKRLEGELEMKDILYTDITEEGLLDYVQENIRATEAYYAMLDKEKGLETP